jgi:hypothetical protein
MKTVLVLVLAEQSSIPDPAELLILTAISCTGAIFLLVLAAAVKWAKDFALVFAACCAFIPLIAWIPWLAKTFSRLLADPSLLSDPSKLLPH